MEPASERPKLKSRAVFAERSYSYDAPIGVMFAALATVEGMWWVDPSPGEIRPRILEVVALRKVVWSSFWPVSPRDTIEFGLSEGDTDRKYLSREEFVDERPTLIRFRWYSDYPPDDRGIAITRQRLNEKIGGALRSVVSEYYRRGPSEVVKVRGRGGTIRVPIVLP